MSTSVCFVIVAHTDAHLVARLAKLLIAQDGLVAIHFDLNAPSEEFAKLRAELGDQADRIIWPKRVRVGWGEWSIVQATLNALEAVAAAGPAPDFVHLMSGSDYPIRSIQDFRDFLQRNKDVEHIECVDMMSENWVKGGLSHERYAYRHFFNWKKYPVLFDRSWRWQRKLGLGRRFVSGLRPHLGSQWWTLSWPTVQKVLAAGRNRRIASFFHTVWIPDEMFIQSVVAGSRLPPERAPILTLYQFTEDGVPVVYYNDHAEYLARQPFFFARKISPYADRLRDELDEYASGARSAPAVPDAAVGIRTDEYKRFLETTSKPRPGTRLLGYEKDQWRGDLVYQEKPVIGIFGASMDELKAIAALLNKTGRYLCHGALFHPDHIEFADDAPRYAGYSRADVALRDDSRHNFLYAIVTESEDDRTVGFLAPWTMDEHIRGRMLWCSFSRTIIVRGNVVRAFEEQLDRRQPNGSVRGGRDAATPFPVDVKDPMSTQAFADFNQRYDAYINELVGEFRHAGARYREIDLLSGDCMRSLIAFLQADGPANPQTARSHRTTLTRDALFERVLSGTSARDTAHVRALVDSIPGIEERRAHLKDFARIVFDRGDVPHVAVVGASTEEVHLIDDLIQHAGSAHRLETGAGHDGGSQPSSVPRNGHFDHEGAAPPDSKTSVAISWGAERSDVSDFICGVQGISIVIVRGNIFRAYREYQERLAASKLQGHSGEDDQPIDHHERTPEVDIQDFFADYEDFYRRWDDECAMAKADCLTLDLMSGAWLRDLLHFVGEAQDEDEARRFLLDRIASLSNPRVGPRYQRQIANAIKDEDIRRAHILALR